MKRSLVLTAVVSAALIAPAAASAQDPRVVGGADTTIDEWPWQVAIADPPATGGDGYDRQFCGGSLIAPTVALTAAHCTFDDGAGDFAAPGDFSVITGTTTLSDAAPPHEIPAIDVIYPVDSGGGTPAPESQLGAGHGTFLYDPDTTVWDFAILELAHPAPPPAQPIQLATASDWAAGDDVWVTGWGDTTPQAQQYPDDLQEAEVQITADADCEGAYSPLITIDPTTMVCAAAPGKDTCAGDSGGPMVKDLGGGTWRLIGDTSFGIGCANPLYPGVYGRVGDEPMRGAAVSGVAYANANAPHPGAPPSGGSGGGGAGGTAADRDPPDTTISDHPRKRTRKRGASFKFTADEPASFQCSLDGARFEVCTSPFSDRVPRGRHRFVVRAIDAANNIDLDGAAFEWKVRRKRH
jgi:Trypsin